MGFSLDDVCDGQEGHSAEFTCAICFNLVDAPLLTRCQHVFCLSCLQDWMNAKPTCPTCSTELDPRHGAGELKLASPLAYRVLGRLRVRCPLHKQGCQWVGDYSELTAHMTSSEAHQAAAPGMAAPDGAPAQKVANDAVAAAEAMNQAANSKFEQRIFDDALKLYTKAIDQAPKVPKYYTNRAAVYLTIGRYDDALVDCGRALALDPNLVKAHKRIAKAYSEQGKFDKAVEQLRLASKGGGGDDLKGELEEAAQLLQWQTEGLAAVAHGDFSLARTFFGSMLRKTSASATKLALVRAELGLGICDGPLRTTLQVIKRDPNVSEAYMLRGVALMLNADLDQAQKHLREALRLDPDDKEAGQTMKKVRKLERHMDAAKQAANTREFGVAASEYSAALSVVDAPQHAPLSASLHAERAAAHLRLRNYEGALKDCAIAIYALDDCKEAWLIKAQALHALERHEEALADMQEVSKTFGADSQIQHALQRASFEVRKARRPDYYALLQVPTVASSLEIKAAYKARALEWHPDKHTQSEVARAAAESKFKLLGEALEILGDEFQRKLYNEGYDKEAIAERVQAANRAASNHNKDGCCGGGGCGGGC